MPFLEARGFGFGSLDRMAPWLTSIRVRARAADRQCSDQTYPARLGAGLAWHAVASAADVRDDGEPWL